MTTMMSILRGLEKAALAESTPTYDKLMADCGSLLAEAPWQPELLTFQAWTDLPEDYELPPMPFHMAIIRFKRIVSAQTDTQMMKVIS